jgi:hypothetical protein
VELKEQKAQKKAEERKAKPLFERHCALKGIDVNNIPTTDGAI